MKKILKTTTIILWLPCMLFIVAVVYSNINSDIGYAPEQPVEFSHKVHSGDYKIKCLFCHQSAERNSFSELPTTFSCMVCHVALKSESKLIAPVMESFENKKPIQWIRVHKLPDFVKFNHFTHLLSGVDCASCHGYVDKMETVYRTRDFTMAWCLDCHRNPGNNIIKPRDITGLFSYQQNTKQANLNQELSPMTKPAYGAYKTDTVYQKYGIIAIKQPAKGPEQCSACHY